MTDEICGLCLGPWHEGHDCSLAQANPALDFAHRLAVMLECALLDPTGSWHDAHALLDQYRAAVSRWHETLEKAL